MFARLRILRASSISRSHTTEFAVLRLAELDVDNHTIAPRDIPNSPTVLVVIGLTIFSEAAIPYLPTEWLERADMHCSLHEPPPQAGHESTCMTPQ